MHSPPAIHLTIAAEQAGLSLTALVAAQVGPLAAQHILERGGVWLNRRRADDAARPLQSGDQVTIHTPPGGTYAEIAITQADICYEGGGLLALNKQPGWYTTPTPWDAVANIRAALTRFVRERDGPEAYVHLVHQLDRDTSGVLLCTRDRALNGPLQEAFNAGAVAKEYLCICAGEPQATQFDIRSGHGRGRSGLWRLYELEEVGHTLPNGSTVKAAHTSFSVLQRLGGAALLRATLHTGRTHQIRLHLAARGHPLLGDARYGGPPTFGGHVLPGHLLHAASLALRHPLSAYPLEIRAPLPPTMAALLDAAG
jgi:23S rRNA pseudouridine1911/1915/1917 synthase